jgi:single-strand DNA-binding protein
MVKDPLIEITPGGAPVCAFSLATSRFSKNNGVRKEEIGFFDIEAWGKLAQNVIDMGRKGAASG